LSKGLDAEHLTFMEEMIAHKKALKINSGVQTDSLEK
jgi:hypothetical protein